jgi:PAS domain-containing protein
MRRLRVQVTVLLALLGLLVVAWGAAIFLAARDAARSNTSLQSTVERVDELRRSVTSLSRDFVTMETSRRAYLLTGDEAAEDAQLQAEISAVQGFDRVRQLSLRWRPLGPVVERVADEYRAWVRTGHTELATRKVRGARAAALVAARGNADRHFRRLWDRQTALEDQLARAQGAYARSQDRTYGTAQTLAVRTALMMLAALVLLAIWLRRAVGAPADALRSASGRLAGGDLETPVELGVENELGAVASDLETMRRRLAGRMEALERLRHLSAQVVGATSLPRLAEVVLEGLRPEIGATRAVLGAARPGGDLRLRALAGFPDPAVADDIVKADAEIRLVLPLPSLRAGQVVGMADLDQVTAGFPVLGDLVARMGVASLALVPLLSRGRFLGLLALCWTQQHRLNREQEALLGLAGNQIAGALEGALRLEEAERAAGEAQAVFYAIADGVLLTDPYGRVTAMNRALEALTGWTEAEARGRPYAEVLPLAADRADGRPTWSAATAARSRWPSPRPPSSTPAAGSLAGSTSSATSPGSARSTRSNRPSSPPSPTSCGPRSP